MPEPIGSIYDAVGEEGLTQLVAAFYRGVPEDPLLGPLYPDQDFVRAEERLRSFLIYRLGGPPKYIEERGHPRLRQRHAPFAIGEAARDAWMAHMEGALDELAFAPEVDAALRPFFAEVATFLKNRAG